MQDQVEQQREGIEREIIPDVVQRWQDRHLRGIGFISPDPAGMRSADEQKQKDGDRKQAGEDAFDSFYPVIIHTLARNLRGSLHGCFRRAD